MPDPALNLVRRGLLPFSLVLFGALVVLLIIGGVWQQLASEHPICRALPLAD